jgi:filamentous hemagglutinin
MNIATAGRRVAALFASSCYFAFAAHSLAAGVQLPIPCLGTCGPNNAPFVTAGKATATQSGKTLTVNQTSNQAILNWSSFNISADGKVQFNQPAASSIALNRIYDQNPSSIFGQLTANGQIYLVNPNGFLFGATARVNAAGVIASSLNISDATFNAGLLSPQLLQSQPSQPALQSDPILGPDGQPLPVPVVVAAGAQISTPGGRILLAAPVVQNAGTLSAPDGQVVLAAGQKVYLQGSTDPSVRGLVVEVDQGGKAWNQLTGQINADRGNVTLVGLAVNQDGRITASTSVSANGSVRLEAADTLSQNGGTSTITSTHGGTLELGSQSSIDIQPELASTATAVADQKTLPSQITLLGEQVLLEGGSISAPGGTLTAVAAANPSQQVATDGNSQARIRVHAGTSIDVSGSDAELPMSANLVAIQLRANELANDPTQRNGALRGQTVYIDTRVGTNLLGPPGPTGVPAPLQAAEDAIPQNVAVRTTHGGSVSFQSEGDIVVEQGATINVSGGKTTYDGGVMQTTQLRGANGQLYDIGSANPLMTYTGVVNPTLTQTYNKWGVQDVIAQPGLSHYESGYVQGSSAGSVQFAAPNMVLNGTLLGNVVNGPLQRTAASAAMGGTLTLGLPQGTVANIAASGTPDYFAPPVSFAAHVTPVVVSDDAALPNERLDLPVAFLANGFMTTNIYSNGSVTVPQGVPLALAPGGSLNISAPRIDILSDVTAVDGLVQLKTTINSGPIDPTINRAGIRLGDGVVIDVRGQWTNDSPSFSLAQPVGPTLQDGGTIQLTQTIQGGELVLGDNTALRASGGAWLSNTNTLTGGKGGKISLQDLPLDVAFQIGQGVEIDAFGVNGASGGSFSLAAPRIWVVQGNVGSNWSGAQRLDDLTPAGTSAPTGGALTINASLFSADGFSSIDLLGTGAVPTGSVNPDILTVQAGTAIDAFTKTLLPDATYLRRPSGGYIDSFSSVVTLPQFRRAPVDISLRVIPQVNDAPLLLAGLLDVQTGASITTDAGTSGIISLQGVGGVYVDGILRAPAGSITLETLTPQNSSPDPGYRPTLGIELGSHGVLDAGGAVLMTPNDAGLKLGQVLAGGSVQLYGDRGSVIADAGSVINVNGTSAALDVATGLNTGRYISQVVASAAGSVSVRSPESIYLLGTLRAAAGVGDYGKPAGGSLEFDLTQSQQSWFTAPSGADAVPYPTLPLVVQLVSSPNVIASGLQAGAPFGLGQLGVTELAASGVDALKIAAGNTLQLSTSAPLVMARQISIDAPVIATDAGVQASLNADYVLLSNSLQQTSSPAALGAGTGTLSVAAQQLDVQGYVAFTGAHAVTLTSAGDVSLRGVSILGAPLQGGLVLDGNLTIDAARIYPVTQTAFSISTLSPGESVNIGQTNASPGTPLSAGGALAITSDSIDSSGSLFAPFGTISLTAKNLALESGSVTSVSADGVTIPFGSTQLGGAQWQYTAAGAAQQFIAGIPQRQVSLNAPSVTIAAGATVDVRGGGDLYAYEWVPGTGGTNDALAGNAGYYAVIPSLHSPYAPYDPQESAGLPPGQAIYLSGGGGIAAGTYALLPARYALLPGAFLVQLAPAGYSNIVPGQQASLADGTSVVAGYTTFGSTGLHSAGYEAVVVRPGSYGRELATYQDSFASSFFASAAAHAGLPRPNLPADAGELSVTVANQLDFAGSLLTAPADSTARSALVDISASQLYVTGPAQSAPAGEVGLAAALISGWHAGELVLGGNVNPDGSILVGADRVTLGPGAQVQANQVVLVAGQQIDLQSGASLLSNSAAIGGAAPSTAVQTVPVSLTGPAASEAALLAVSDVQLPIVTRSAVGSNPASISVEAGATVGSLGAIAVDAPGSVTLAGKFNGAGASWSLASSSIGFSGGNSMAGPAVADSLNISSDLLNAMQGAGAVRLSAANSIDVYAQALQLGTVSATGAPLITSLTLSAPALNYLGTGGSVGFAAKTITVMGGAGLTAAPTTGLGNLTFSSNEFDIGSGTMVASGFAQTGITASAAVVGGTPDPAAPAPLGLTDTRNLVGVQTSGGISTSGNLTISAPVFTAATAGVARFSALGGTLSINGTATVPPVLPISSGLGGELDFSADSIMQSGAIVLPAGVVSLQAVHDIALSPTASISTGGSLISIVNQMVGSEGGTISLTAGRNLSVAAGSMLNVSGAGDAPAGQIQLVAGGIADVAASLEGKAGATAQGGSFSLDGGSIRQSLSVLGSDLQAGGFTQQLSVRSRTGDLVLDPGGNLTANALQLTADTGAVNIGGTLVAPGSDLRGTINLFGGAGVLLGPTAQLHADTVGGAGIGGNIELGAGPSGGVTLSAGSVVTAHGDATDGTLLIRAPLSPTGTSIAASSHADLSQLGQIVIEPVLTELASNSASNPTIADYTRIQNDIASKMTASAANISAQFNPTGALPVVVRPGVDLVQNGDLTVNVAPNLAAWGFGGQPVDLTVRASGTLNVATTLSDGFVVIPKTNLARQSSIGLSAAPSASIRLVAGADLASPDPLAIDSTGAKDLNIAPGQAVRTGTGEIDLVASGNISFGLGSKVYTAGVPGGLPGAPPYQLVPLSASVFNFPTEGGTVRVAAGGDIIASAQVPTSQKNPVDGPSITSWQIRQGNASTPAEWGVDLAAYNAFGWNLGTLGGGDLSVTAGGNIRNLSAAAADSYIANADGTATHLIGGGLAVTAMGNIGTGRFYAADGRSLLRAGGAFDSSQGNSDGLPVGSLIALGDAQVSVEARLGVAIDGVVNPTIMSQAALGTTLNSTFFTYSDASRLTVQSTAGDITLGNETTRLPTLVGSVVQSGPGGGTQIYPASLVVRALSQDISLPTATMLFPSDAGQLELIAGRDMLFTGGTALIMSDAFAQNAPTPQNPTNPTGTLLVNTAFQSGRHRLDASPAIVAAGRDITNLILSVPKAADIIAGRDIQDLTFSGQNLNPTDVTLISAGRDYRDTLDQLGIGPLVSVGGPGQLDLLANRDVNLGFSSGVRTTGNLLNPNLGAAGADVTIMAGLGQSPDYSALLSDLVAKNPAYETQLISYVDSVTGTSSGSYAAAETAFMQLSSAQRMSFLNDVFFNELLLSGQEANGSAGLGYTRGYNAIDTLFPNSRSAVATGASPYVGDLTLSFSQIYTLSGGNIDLLVPGGLLNVGLANPPASIQTTNPKKPSQLGIVSQGPGNLDIYTKNDVLVNSSRIFTLGGGNILIWSDEGSIDAGQGAKSSVSAPPPQILVDSTGKITLSFNGAVAGSGIRTIQVEPSVPPGNVDLIAPQGTVNAGDAGIGASGNINIAAEHVLGLDNIQFAGHATGVPAQVGDLGASLLGATNVVSGAANTVTSSADEEARKAATAAPLAQTALSWLDVFVTGLGEENCRPDDIECLKRARKN